MRIMLQKQHKTKVKLSFRFAIKSEVKDDRISRDSGITTILVVIDRKITHLLPRWKMSMKTRTYPGSGNMTQYPGEGKARG